METADEVVTPPRDPDQLELELLLEDIRINSHPEVNVDVEDPDTEC